MPINITSKLARQLGVDAQETGRILEDLVQDIRSQVAREGAATVPGLGIFRSFSGRIVFEPERALALAVNHRYAGLEPLLVNAAELTPTAQDVEPLEESPSTDLYPPEAPSFVVHPVDAGAEEPAERDYAETGDLTEHDGPQPPFAEPTATRLDKESRYVEEETFPAADLDADDLERIETAALAESTPEDVAAPEDLTGEELDLREPADLTEEVTGAEGPPPEVTVHEFADAAEEPEGDLAAADGVASAESAYETDEPRDDEDLAEQLEEPALPTSPSAASPFFEPFPEEIDDIEPEPVRREGVPEERPYDLIESGGVGVYPEEAAEDVASEEPLREAITDEQVVEEASVDEAALIDAEPAPAETAYPVRVEDEENVLPHEGVEEWPDYREEEQSVAASEPGFRPEPIDDDYAFAAAPVPEPSEAEPFAPVHSDAPEPVFTPPPPAAERKRSRTPLVLVAVAVLALLAALAYFLTRPEAPVPPAVVENQPPAVAPSDTASALAAPADTAGTPAGEAEPEPIVTDPAPPTPLRPDGGIDVSQGGLTLVVASVGSRDEAERVAERFRQAGYSPAVFYGEYGGVIRYRIGIGQFLDEEAAEAERNDLPEIFPRDAWLMPIQRDMEVIE